MIEFFFAMTNEWLIDVTITESLFESIYPVSLALTDFEHFTCHGVIQFSPSVIRENSENHKSFAILRSKIGQSFRNDDRKRSTNYVAPFRPNKQPKFTAPTVAQNIDGDCNSGNHISEFQKVGCNQRIFTCDLCGKQSNSRAYLSKHVKMIHKSNTEAKKCEMCSFSTKWPESLKRHYISTHKIPKTFAQGVH